MGNPQDTQLKLVCNETATLAKARQILQLAKIKTRPGSGYHIGADSAIGLPAVCAYLASQELKSGDVSQKVAQNSSCLNEKVFLKTLKTVSEALYGSSNQQNATDGLNYVDLNREYTGSRSSKVAGWMKDIEKVLVMKEVLTPNHDPKSDLVRCAVFCSVLEIMKMKSPISEVVEDYELPRKHFDYVLKLINKECESVAKKIRSELEVMSKHSGVSTSNVDSRDSLDVGQRAEDTIESALQSRTRSGTASPSKSTLKNKTTEDSLFKSPRKRGVTFEPPSASGSRTSIPQRSPIKKPNLLPAPATPKKGSKAADGLSAFHAALSDKKPEKRLLLEDEEENPFVEPIPTRAKRARARSPLREYPMEVDDAQFENEEAALPNSAPRRFRPVWLDRKQWTSRDPRIAREWPVVLEHVNNMVDLYGHPFISRNDVEMQTV